MRREAKAESQDVVSPKEGNHQGQTHEQVAKEIMENERQEVIKTGWCVVMLVTRRRKVKMEGWACFKIKKIYHWRNKNKVDKNKLFPGKRKFKNRQSL